MFHLLKYVPKNLLSYIVGFLVHLPLPTVFASASIKWFAARYRANIEEAAQPIDSYASIGDFFTRSLKHGARPIGEGIVSPADGSIENFGAIDGGRLLQVKGREYSLEELLCDGELALRFANGFFVTIYLAPGDYHRVHTPVSGQLTESVYIPGSLWPVNEWSVKNIDKLFCVNERVVSCIQGDSGSVAVVMVGATNVGRMEMSYDGLVTNTFGRIISGDRKPLRTEHNADKHYQKGEHLGTFNMGSTVVLLFECGRFVPGAACQRGKIRLGASIGK